MGIRELEVKGFRSLRDVRWEPGKLNVLIGPNGSGKSNLLQALEFLKFAAKDDLSEEVLRGGGMVPLLWDSKAQGICWRLRTLLEGTELSLEALYQLDLRQIGSTSAFRIEKEQLNLGTNAIVMNTSLVRNPTTLKLTDQQGELVNLPKNVISDEVSALGLAFMAGTELALLCDKLRDWSFYHNLRVNRESLARQAAVARRERSLNSDGGNLIPLLHTFYTGNRQFKKNLDAAMRAAFGSDYEEIVFPPAADQMIQLRLRWRSLSTEQSAANLSDGTLRFLMLIAILANPAPGDLIAIDEPETGLHPNMFPIIAELAAEAAERTQVIFTTHSPQFLDAFREEPPTTTVAEWVDGETHLSVIAGEDLQKWLSHYSLGTLFRSGELEALA